MNYRQAGARTLQAYLVIRGEKNEVKKKIPISSRKSSDHKRRPSGKLQNKILKYTTWLVCVCVVRRLSMESDQWKAYLLIDLYLNHRLFSLLSHQFRECTFDLRRWCSAYSTFQTFNNIPPLSCQGFSKFETGIQLRLCYTMTHWSQNTQT